MPRPHDNPRIIVFLGPPGSGKGTQAARLSAELGVPAISTGDMLRRECQSGSPLGESLKSILASGQLVSDDLINQVVASRLRNSDCTPGCILDGYPRTVAQARYLDALLASRNRPRPIVFDFEICADHIVSRLSRRRYCPHCGTTVSVDPRASAADLLCPRDGSRLMQRSDDNPSVIVERLRQCAQNSAELVRYYCGQDYHRIDANRSPDDISDDLLSILAANWSTPVLSRAATAVPSQSLRA